MSFFLWIGLIVLVIVLLVLMDEDWRLVRGPRRHAIGTVVDHVSSTDDGSELFAPKVQFQADDGRAVVITDTYGTPTRRPPVGAALPVVYVAGAPDKAQVHRPLVRAMLYVFVLGLLGVLLALAFGYIRS